MSKDCSNSCVGDMVGIVLLIVLFWNFDNNTYDLYDLIYNYLIKVLGG